MRKHRELSPFVGVDGEGAGFDRNRRQHFMLFRIGDRELYTGKPLRLEQLLDFILATPPKLALYGYSFGYDATQILRLLPPDRFTNEHGTGLFDPHDSDVHYTYHAGKYGLEYRPYNHMRVCLLEPYQRRDGTVGLHTIKGTTRTIFDGYNSFRQPFIKALERFEIGRKHWPLLLKMKDARASWSAITPEIRAYCELECELIAELMERLRAQSHALALRPASFNGGGKFASYLHHKHKTPTANFYKMAVPREARALMANAFSGHRFETVRIGDVTGPIYEYDQNSAYPAAMRGLPCCDWRHTKAYLPRGGAWARADARELVAATLDGSLFVARAAFSNPPEAPIGALPVRRENGRLAWPLTGEGVYWSDELRAARRFGCSVELFEGWIYRPLCDCQTFLWVEPLFHERKVLGDAGEPLKIALAALTGKFAQRRYGIGRYHNLMYAGLVTARERAAVLDLARHDPAAVTMIAGDGIFSSRPLPASIGDGLGEWKQKAVHPSVFIVQPGLYWTPGMPRTKGIPTSVFASYIPAFEKAWQTALRSPSGMAPAVSVRIRMFNGLRLAVLSGHPEDAGKWYVENNGKGRLIAFNAGSRGALWLNGRALVTSPPPGGKASLPYDPEQAEAFDLNRLQLDEQQDAIDLTPP